MKPEEITTSLEWSIKLKAAGFPQGTTRDTWSTTESGANASLHERVQPGHTNYGSPFYLEYDAPYSEEILRKLPAWEAYTHTQGGFGVDTGFHKTHEDTLANAAAAAYCYLAEQKLL